MTINEILKLNPKGGELRVVIEQILNEHLVITNKQSIHLSVDKLLALIDRMKQIN